jgi:tRNA (guanine6-N2)-methyltransferase
MAERPTSPRLLVHAVPGLEQPLAGEIAERFPEAELVGIWRQFDERTSLLEFRTPGDCCAWRSLDTAEDVFILVARARAIQPDRRGLGELAAATLSSKLLSGGLRIFADCRGEAPRTYRVVARKAGEHAYRRVDAQRAVEGALRTLLPRQRLVEDDADAEFWLTVIGSTALLGLRLSDAAMRGHSYPFLSLPASLKPSIARAMARLSRPLATDRILDPLCGAGTLLWERAAVGPWQTLTGGDRDPAALEAARANANASRLTVTLQRWDAQALPLADRSIDVVLTNPPFGKQLAIPGEDSDAFYRRLLLEIRRVLTPEGRLVLITSQTRAMERAVPELRPRLTIESRLPVLVRGQRATIFSCRGPFG